MKKATSSRLKIHLKNISLQDVEKLELRFRQGKVEKDFVYNAEVPNDAVSVVDEHHIDLVWSAEDKALFHVGKVSFDTRVTLKGTTDQPNTGPIKEIDMSPSLFE